MFLFRFEKAKSLRSWLCFQYEYSLTGTSSEMVTPRYFADETLSSSVS